MNCEKCDHELTDDKFKDVICKDGHWFTVYLRSCPSCGHVVDEATWVE